LSETPLSLPPPSPARVLVVDDQPQNVELLHAYLSAEGHEVLPAASGAEALERLSREMPDLLLLDAMMPGMSGLEVARRVKADPQTGRIPILMVTALQGEEERARAIDAGADDFVSKPVSQNELLTRVRSLVRIGRLHAELARQRDELEAKAAELEAAERARDDLTSMLVHDLRSPLNTLLMGLQYIRMSGLVRGRERAEGVLARSETAGAHMMRLINNILDVSRLQAGRIELALAPLSLSELLTEVVGAVTGQAEHRGVRVSLSLPPDLPEVVADRVLLERVFVNLLDNALKFGPPASEVQLGVRADGTTLRAEVRDWGPGVPPEARMRIFEKFGQARMVDPDVPRSPGLGLAFCKLAIEAHAGRIGLEDPEGGGSLFFVELPLAGPQTGVAGG
jgi:two-component system sensor histidine kinase/response regulator